MKTVTILAILVLTLPQEQVKIDFLLNGQIHDINNGIKLSEFEQAFIQLSLVEGLKVDKNKPLSGEVFIRSGDNAVYMEKFENLEEKIYMTDFIESITDYKIKPGDFLVILVTNIVNKENENKIVLNIPFSE